MLRDWQTVNQAGRSPTNLRILIEGHTHSVGTAPANLSLSDARAAAVKATLVADFAIDAGRFTTKGGRYQTVSA